MTATAPAEARLTRQATAAVYRCHALTPRELEVLQALASGDTVTTMARRWGISVKTVNTHLGAINRKLGTGNQTQAVLAAVRAGKVRVWL